MSAALASAAVASVPALADAHNHSARSQATETAFRHHWRHHARPAPSASTSAPTPTAATPKPSPTAQATTPAPTSSGSTIAAALSGAGSASVGYNADDGSTPSYGSYSMIMANSWSTGILAAAKSAGKVPVIYQDLTSVRTDDAGSASPSASVIVNGQICPAGVTDARFTATGLGFCWVWRYHRQWLLTQSGTASAATTRSQLVAENGFPTQYIVNWGNPAYQQAWAQAVIARCKALGVRWVFADNALTYADAYTNSPLRLFPTNAAVQAGTLAAMKVITAALNAQGIHIIYNVGYTSMFDASPSSSLWDKWLPYSNGLTNEFPQYQGYSGDVANQKQACRADGKVCWFGRNGLAPLFDIVGNPATVTAG